MSERKGQYIQIDRDEQLLDELREIAKKEGRSIAKQGAKLLEIGLKAYRERSVSAPVGIRK